MKKRKIFSIPSRLYSGAYAVFTVGMSIINLSLIIISYFLFSPSAIFSETRTLLYIRASEGFDTLIASILIVFFGVYLLDRAYREEKNKE
jgi:hypothetical protein